MPMHPCFNLCSTCWSTFKHIIQTLNHAYYQRHECTTAMKEIALFKKWICLFISSTLHIDYTRNLCYMLRDSSTNQPKYHSTRLSNKSFWLSVQNTFWIRVSNDKTEEKRIRLNWHSAFRLCIFHGQWLRGWSLHALPLITQSECFGSLCQAFPWICKGKWFAW